MNASIPWVGGVVWVVSYLGLVAVRGHFERWTIARLHGRRTMRGKPGLSARPTLRNVPAVLASAVALVAAAMLPLTARPTGTWLVLPSHALEGMDGSLLLVLALHSIAMGLLSIESGAKDGPPLNTARRLEGASAILIGALPALVALLSLSLTTDTLTPRLANRWSIAALVQAQGGWGGFRWMAAVQPLALSVWGTSLVAQRPREEHVARWARQAVALNQGLLTTVVWFGGWQGPLAEGRPWLGLLYTLAKVGAITFVQIWARASKPQVSLDARLRAAWTVCTPLAALNLLVTAWVCVYAGGAG